MLTEQQLKQNIDALVKQGAPNGDIQGYLNTLKKNSDGTYSKPGEAAAQPEATPWSQKPSSIFSWKVSNDELQSQDISKTKSVARPLVNLALSPLATAEKVAKIPFNAVSLAKEQGLGELNGGGILGAGTEVAKNLSGIPLLSKIGNTALGALGAGISKVTGKNIASPDEQAAYESAKNFITHPQDSATKVAQGVYATSQEDPMNIPLALEGAAQASNKYLGTNLGSPVSNMASVVTEPTKAITRAVATPFKGAAIEKRAADYEKILNPSKGLAASEAKYEKDSPKFAAQLEGEGVKFKFGRDERGRLDTSEAQSSLQQIAERDNASLESLLKSSGANLNLDDAANAARAEARRVYKGTAQDSALTHIDEELSAYKRQYQGQGFSDTKGQFNVPANVGNEIKKDLWSKSKFPPFGTPTDQVNAGTKFLFGHGIKDSIEGLIGQDNLVGRLNKRLGDIASLDKMFQKAQGGAIHGGFMGRMAGRIIGGIAGSGGGPAGTVAGAITGDMITSALSDPNKPLSWSQMILRRAQAEQPAILKEVETAIGKNANELLNRKLLPAPSYIEAGAKTPNPSTVSAPEAARSFGTDPKTGQFKRVYTSEPKTNLGQKLINYAKDPNLGLSVKDTTKLLPSDSKTLRKFIDAVRLEGTSEAPNMSEADWTAAERIILKTGGSLNQPLAKMANHAQDLIEGAKSASALYKTGRPYAIEKGPKTTLGKSTKTIAQKSYLGRSQSPRRG